MALGNLSPDYNNAPAAGVAAVVALPAIDGKRRIRGVDWSYSGDPTGGSIKIEDGAGTVVFGPHAITSGGPGQYAWTWGLEGSDNKELIVTLAAASGVTGALTVHVDR